MADVSEGESLLMREEVIKELSQVELPRFEVGQIVSGQVIQVDEQGALVNIGTKTEALIPATELSIRSGWRSPKDIVKVGQMIEAMVLKVQGVNVLLSKRQADEVRRWEQIKFKHASGATITGKIKKLFRDGFLVDIGVPAFLPNSEVPKRALMRAKKLIGIPLKLKILELESSYKINNKPLPVISWLKFLQEEQEKRRQRTLESLEVGKDYSGIIRSITNYGAFVDLGGIEGLLHISEMSWTHISHPSEILRAGQRVKVRVLKLDTEAGKISLGLKQLQPNPWQQFAEEYHPGEIVSGEVSKLLPTVGALVKLPFGIEGLVPISELSRQRVKEPGEAVEVGKPVKAKIIAIKPDEHRVTLSIKAVELQSERQFYKEFIRKQQAASKKDQLTMGKLYRKFLREQQRKEKGKR